jgi:hypothetical protein
MKPQRKAFIVEIKNRRRLTKKPRQAVVDDSLLGGKERQQHLTLVADEAYEAIRLSGDALSRKIGLS